MPTSIRWSESSVRIQKKRLDKHAGIFGRGFWWDVEANFWYLVHIITNFRSILSYMKPTLKLENPYFCWLSSLWGGGVDSHPKGKRTSKLMTSFRPFWVPKKTRGDRWGAFWCAAMGLKQQGGSQPSTDTVDNFYHTNTTVTSEYCKLEKISVTHFGEAWISRKALL